MTPETNPPSPCAAKKRVAAATTENLQLAAPNDFRLAMRQVASSVAVITTTAGDEQNGLTATAVSSVSAEPPTILVCINRESSTGRLIAESGILSVNFLGADHEEIAKKFATPKLSGAERFAAGDWKTLDTGAPVLADAVAAFDCRVVRRLEEGTHAIYICRVVAVKSRDAGALLYHDGTFGKLATAQ